jgi:DNA-binding IclR family transcriptional regulator
MTDSGSTRRAGAKTLDNGIALLQALARHPDGQPVTALARETGVHRTVAYRLLGSLLAARLVEQRPDGAYVLGLGLIELAGTVRGGLQDAAAPVLRRLADEAGATAFLAARDGDDVVGIAVIEPAGAGLHVSYRVGQRHPAVVGADGMALLAGGEPRDGERPEITQARSRGYAVSTGEVEPGAWGLATWVPARSGAVEASIGVIALRQLPEEDVAPLVRAAAHEIGQRVG